MSPSAAAGHGPCRHAGATVLLTRPVAECVGVLRRHAAGHAGVDAAVAGAARRNRDGRCPLHADLRGSQPRGFGRIVRSHAGDVLAIVEEADCTPEQLRLTELNPGLYCYDADWLWRSLDQITVSPKGEYYLTDLVAIAVSQGRQVLAHKVSDRDRDAGHQHPRPPGRGRGGAASAHQPALDGGGRLDCRSRHYLHRRHGRDRPDTVLLPGVRTCAARRRIGEDCRIGPNSIVHDSRQSAMAASVQYSVLEGADPGGARGCWAVRPPAPGRPPGPRRSHGQLRRGQERLPGPRRQDGPLQLHRRRHHRPRRQPRRRHHHLQLRRRRKHHTIIGDHVFIGSDTMLVAPLTLAPARVQAPGRWSHTTCRRVSWRWACQPESGSAVSVPVTQSLDCLGEDNWTRYVDRDGSLAG